MNISFDDNQTKNLIRPKSSYMEFVHFKDDILKSIHQFQNDIEFKNKEKSMHLEERLNYLENSQSKFLEKCSNLLSTSAKFSVKAEKVDLIDSTQQNLASILTVTEEKLSTLLKEFSSSCFKYDKLILNNLYIPGILGENYRYKNLREYIIQNNDEISKLKHSNEKNEMEIKLYKAKIEGLVKEFYLLSEGLRKNAKEYINCKIEDIQTARKYEKEDIDKKIESVKLENQFYSEIVKQRSEGLQKDMEELKKLKLNISSLMNNTVDKTEKIKGAIVKEFNNLKDQFLIIKGSIVTLAQYLSMPILEGSEDKIQGIKKEIINNFNERLIGLIKEIGVDKINKHKKIPKIRVREPISLLSRKSMCNCIHSKKGNLKNLLGFDDNQVGAIKKDIKGQYTIKNMSTNIFRRKTISSLRVLRPSDLKKPEINSKKQKEKLCSCKSFTHVKELKENSESFSNKDSSYSNFSSRKSSSQNSEKVKMNIKDKEGNLEEQKDTNKDENKLIVEEGKENNKFIKEKENINAINNINNIQKENYNNNNINIINKNDTNENINTNKNIYNNNNNNNKRNVQRIKTEIASFKENENKINNKNNYNRLGLIGNNNIQNKTPKKEKSETTNISEIKAKFSFQENNINTHNSLLKTQYSVSSTNPLKIPSLRKAELNKELNKVQLKKHLTESIKSHRENISSPNENTYHLKKKKKSNLKILNFEAQLKNEKKIIFLQDHQSHNVTNNSNSINVNSCIKENIIEINTSNTNKNFEFIKNKNSSNIENKINELEFFIKRKFDELVKEIQLYLPISFNSHLKDYSIVVSSPGKISRSISPYYTIKNNGNSSSGLFLSKGEKGTKEYLKRFETPKPKGLIQSKYLNTIT